MRYFELDITTEKEFLPEGKRKEELFAKDICSAISFFNGKERDKTLKIYFCDALKQNISIAVATEYIDSSEPENEARLFLQSKNIGIESIQLQEITIERFIGMIRRAVENDYQDYFQNVIRELKLHDADNFEGTQKLMESMTSEFKDHDSIKEAMNAVVCYPELESEINRILKSKQEQRYAYHPVHYIVMTDDASQKEKLRELITGSLYYANRLTSRRMCIAGTNTGSEDDEYINTWVVERLYRMQKGATVVLQPVRCANIGNVADRNMSTLKRMCAIMFKHFKETLSIFELGKDDEKALEIIRSELPEMRFVLLKEESLNKKGAMKYLRGLAADDSISDVRKLIRLLPENETSFDTKLLKNIYTKWFSSFMCNEVFPQYKDLKPSEVYVEKKAKGSAYKELMDMIGLSDAKKVLQNAIDFNRARKSYKEHGIEPTRVSHHMVFTGNPGSAKTTVARLFAQIMRDNDVYPEGNFIEAGRQDIVDMYLGGTAPRVHRLFEKAKGGVLFIDEAYSLVDGHRGLYGDEAINAIVQEMENHKDDTMVVFAGYPDKMNAFLDSNPGLRSRIAFHVHFDDYNADELFQILQLFARKQKMRLDVSAEKKVKSIFEEACRHSDFGNGRFVRNMFEQAQMRQAGRIVSRSPEGVTSEYVATLIADDFEMPKEYTKANNQVKTIGFIG